MIQLMPGDRYDPDLGVIHKLAIPPRLEATAGSVRLYTERGYVYVTRQFPCVTVSEYRQGHDREWLKTRVLAKEEVGWMLDILYRAASA